MFTAETRRRGEEQGLNADQHEDGAAAVCNRKPFFEKAFLLMGSATLLSLRYAARRPAAQGRIFFLAYSAAYPFSAQARLGPRWANSRIRNGSMQSFDGLNGHSIDFTPVFILTAKERI